MSFKERTPNGGVAQLGEHLPCKQGVMGSNPIISTSGHSPLSMSALESRYTPHDGTDTETAMRKMGEEKTRYTEGNLHGLIAQVVRARA